VRRQIDRNKGWIAWGSPDVREGGDYDSARDVLLRIGDILRQYRRSASCADAIRASLSDILLVLVIDPSQCALVVSALSTTPPSRRLRVVTRECLIAYAVLLGFLFGGHAFLTVMHLSETSLSIAGGVISF